MEGEPSELACISQRSRLTVNDSERRGTLLVTDLERLMATPITNLHVQCTCIMIFNK